MLGRFLHFSIAIAALAHLASAQQVGISFNSTGLSSLTYGTTDYLDYGDLRLNAVVFANGSAGNPAGSVLVNAAAQTQTRTYDWGTIVVNYAPAGNRLNLLISVRNNSSVAIRQVWFEPLGLRFPSSPSEFDLGYPLLRHTLGQAAAQSMTYTGGAMVLASDDVVKPILLGFPRALNGPTNTRFPIIVTTDRISSYGDIFPVINRPIAPGATEEFRLSLRFGGPGSTLATLGADVFQAFALAYPAVFSLADRRPIAQLVLSDSGRTSATNPRGWLFDPSIDVTTIAGRTAFRQRILEYITYSIPIMQSMNAQGAITWDIEGQEFPHAYSYIGDPRLATTLAPEMADLVDEYFAAIRAAGLRVGLTLRPQQFILSPIQQKFVTDPAQLLQLMTDKINYARTRWGANVFYIDSNTNETDPNPIDPTLFQSLQAIFPDTLFLAEHSNMRYHAYVGAYKELAQGHTSTPPEIRVAYPNAATFIYTPNADAFASSSQLTAAFQQGDSYLFRGWYPDPLNEVIRRIYLAARPGPSVTVTPQVWSLRPGQSQQFTASATGVTWRIIPEGAGAITPSGLYTAPAGITGPTRDLLVQAMSPVAPFVSGVASIQISQGVAITMMPAFAALTAGQSQQFTSTVDGTSLGAVNWLMNPQGIGTLSSTGVYTAPATLLTPKTITVTALSVADPLKSATATVTVSPGVLVTVSPLSASLGAGQSQQFSASVLNTEYTAVLWSVSPPGAGTLSPTGLYTASSNIPASQSITVTAISLADPTKSANATLSLIGTVAVWAAPLTVTLTASQTQQFTATVINAANPSVTWSLTGPGTLSAAGLYTAPATISALQTVTVTATSLEDATKAAAVSITLMPTVTVSAAPLTATLTANQSQQFTATVINAANAAVTWSLSGPGTLSPAGLYTVPALIATTQSASITATSVADPTKSATALITLLPPVAVTVTPLSVTLSRNQTQQFTATVVNAANAAVTWSLTGPGTLSTTGLYSAPAAIPAPQTATITATSAADPTKAATASVTLAPTVAVTAAPLLATLSSGQSQQFTAALTGTANPAVTWSVVPPVGTISATGLYTAPANVPAPQTVTVIATSVADVTKSATASVNLVLASVLHANGYAFRRAVTIDHTRVPNTDQVNFPILVSGVVPSLATFNNGGRVQSPNGFDIVFAADAAGATPLNWEVESYNPATGAVSYWVKVPLLSHTVDTNIYLFYGKAGIDSFQGNRTGTWDNNFVAVYHLSDSIGNAILDSSAANNSGTNLAPTAGKLVAGQIAGALSFNGATDFAVANSSPTLALAGQVTLEAWVNVNALPALGDQIYIAGKGYNGSNEGYFLRLFTNNGGTTFVQAGTFTFPESYQAQVPVTGFAGAWHHVVGTYNGTWSVYVDGVRTTSFVGVGPLQSGEPFAIGARSSTGTRRNFLNGAIDEVRVSNIARSPDWIATALHNQISPLPFGPEETAEDTTIVAVSVTPTAATLSANQTQQFSATVINAASPAVTWTLSGPGTLSATGLYLAPGTISAPQSATLTATSIADPTKSAGATVTLIPTVAVSLAPLIATLGAGQTQQFAATVTGAANTAVTWTLSGVGTLSATGLYAAPAGVPTAQNVTITALSIADPTKSATASITLTPDVAISVAPLTASLSANQSQQFTATVTNTANPTLTWSLAGPGTLSPTGLYTAPVIISAPQTVTITATSAADPTRSASASVTLLPPVAVTVTPLTATLNINQAQQFAALVLNAANTAVTWTLSGAGTLSATGLYTAPPVISTTQTVTITVNSVADPTKSAAASVTLAPIVTIAAAPLTATLGVNQSQQFTATVTNAANAAVTWTLSGVGTLSSAGLYTAPAVISTTQTVTITATSVADPTKSAGASVTLTPPVAIALTPLTATLGVNQTRQFTATVSNAANTSVIWSLTGAGTLSPTGLYTAPAIISAPQTVTITAASVADNTRTITASVNLIVAPVLFANGYSYRRDVTIDHTRIPNTDHTNFPVLVSGVYPALATLSNGGRVQNPNGFDIVFAADAAGAIPLNWEVESYHPATGAFSYWVKVPLVSHTTDTTIHLFYGKAGVESFQGNRLGTWDSNYVAVYHLSDKAANYAVADSSAAGNAGTNQSPTTAKSVAGRIEGALAFNGAGDAASAVNSPSLAITSQVTVEAWVKMNALPALGEQTYIAGKGYNGSNEGYFLRLATNNGGTTFLQAGTFTFPESYQAQVALTGFAGAWHHVVGTFNGTWNVYVDGVRTTSSATLGPLQTGERFAIGARSSTGTYKNFLNGAIDEVRVSNIARTPDWIAAGYLTQTNSAILGPEQTP